MINYFDSHDPIRIRVRGDVQKARQSLLDARDDLIESGYVQIRFDQYEHPSTKVMVETGYTHGETRLVVHRHPQADRFDGEDFRLVGGETHDDKYHRFRDLISTGATA